MRTKPIHRRRRKGSMTVEYVIAFAGLLLPVTMALVFTSQMLWIWHSVVDFTRDGARYASTHCWNGGENVRTYMTTHVPLMFDQDQFRNGPASIDITYYGKDPDSGDLAEFSCDQGDCSTGCVPDVVKIGVSGYEFRTFVTSYLGLPPVTLPNFWTTLPMESVGCDPEQGQCLP